MFHLQETECVFFGTGVSRTNDSSSACWCVLGTFVYNRFEIVYVRFAQEARGSRDSRASSVGCRNQLQKGQLLLGMLNNMKGASAELRRQLAAELGILGGESGMRSWQT